MTDTLHHLAAGLLNAWSDQAAGYTCDEAETMHRLITLLHSRDAADDFMVSHSYGDDEDSDLHHGWTPDLGPLTYV